jgi:hypothetical protein
MLSWSWSGSRLARRLVVVLAAAALGACGSGGGAAAPGGAATAAAGARGSSGGGGTGPTGSTGATGAASSDGPGDLLADLEDGASLPARARRGLEISPVPLSLDGLSARERALVGLGSYIVNAASDCAGCHGLPPAFLAGGTPFSLGGGQVVWTRNLTPDPTTGLPLTRDQFFEAIRTGRDFHGNDGMLVVMPWTTLRWASDLDLDGIYAYLRAIPPVVNAVPPDVKGALHLPTAIPFDPTTYTDGDVARKLKGAHVSFSSRRGLAISPVALAGKNPGKGPDAHARDSWGGRSVGVGSYIANSLAHCNDCHTHPDRTADGAKVNTASFLAGGTVFATPPPLQPVLKTVRATSANLEGATHGFFHEPGDSYERFRAVITTGTLVDETPPRPLAFPMMLVAPNLAKLLEADLRAVYDWAKAIPATTGASDVAHPPPARWCAADGDCASGETCSGGECVGGACTTDLDCGTCQTCGGGTCAAPAADSICVLTAQ